MLEENLISARNISITTSHGTLFDSLTCSFATDSRVGLVGANGAGKSTLLRVLAKLIPPEEVSGEIIYRRNLKIEYVPQFIPQELFKVSLLDAIVEKLASASPPREEWEAYVLLEKFGFDESMLGSKFCTLSGGEANRALLARAIAAKPDFIFLDEPTNHMDSEAISWFEHLLQNELKIPFCFVSHDRDLLDHCTNTTFFLRDHQIYEFRIPYSQAVKELSALDQSLIEKQQDQKKELARLESSANQLQVWAKNSDKMAPRLRAMRTRVEKLEKNMVTIPRQLKREIGVSTTGLRVKNSLQVENLEVVVGNRSLFTVESFSISPGERIAILGPNGTGKTSFLRVLEANFHVPQNQCIRFNPQSTLGYYDQELASLPLKDSIFDYLQKSTSAGNETIRVELITAGFAYERHSQRIETLSGGEKARIQFLTLKLKAPSLLLLDEPTNHIDVEGIENLEYHLTDSPAACIFVSHDRRFLKNVAERFFLISAGKLAEIGNLDEYYEELWVHSQRENT